jgi:signal transduction histidine kinase
VVRFGAAEGLPTGLALCWYEDREGNIWVGLQGGGLVCLRPRVFQEVSLPGEPRVKVASSVCEDGGGELCIGTVDGVLFRQRGETFDRFTPPIEIYRATDLKVAPADGRRLWVASQQNGVVLFDDGKFTYPFPADALGNGPDRARVICRGAGSALWICSETGLSYWDGIRLKQAEGFDADRAAQVLSMHEAGDGTLWLGMATGELLRYAGGQMTSYRPDDAGHDGEKAMKRRESFWALQAGDEGTLWIGTMGGGLLRFNNGNFTRFTVSNGLADDSVRQILEDGRGRLWIGTNSGISHAELTALDAYAKGQTEEVPWVSYGRSAGLPTLECLSGIQPSCWRGRDGRLWFTTAKGAVWTDPGEIRQNRLAPPVVLEQVVVDGRNAGGALVPKSVMVPPGRHLLEFAFTALSLTEPSKVRFQWQLSGLEDDWVDGGHMRSVSYSSVPPGRYRFQVRACNNDGVWNQLGAAVDLTVRPFYWQTWWFKAGLGVTLVLGLIGGTIVVQRRRYRARLRVLKQHAAIESERMRIARDIHDQVGASLTKMGVQAERLAHEPTLAEACQPLVRDVADTTRELLNAMDEIVWTVNPRNDTLENSANYLIHYTREFLRPAGIDYLVDMPLELPNHSISAELRHNLFMSVKEALSNAVKHGRPERVRLALDVQPQAWVFMIEDDGCGFSPSAIARSESDGLGNMSQRMLAVGGQCEIESSTGAGTRVTLRLPRCETAVT